MFVIVLLSLITYNHWYNALYSVPAVIKRKIMTSYDLLLFLFLLKPFQWLFIMMIFAMNSRYRGYQHLFDSIVYHKMCFFYFASNIIIFSHNLFCYQVRVISYAFIWKFCKSEVVLDTIWFFNVWNIYQMHLCWNDKNTHCEKNASTSEQIWMCQLPVNASDSIL